MSLAALRGAAPWPKDHLSIGQKIYASLSPLFGAPGVFGTWAWFLILQAALAITVIEARRRNRDALLLAGVLVTGYLMSAISLARGPMSAGYYIPWVAAVAAVAFRCLAYANARSKVAVVALAAALIPLSTPAALAEWKQKERSGAAALSLSKGIAAAGCPLYLANFHIEPRLAVPFLFGFGHTARIPPCAPRSPEAYVVSWENKPLSIGFATACRTRWAHVAVVANVGLYHCPSLKQEQVLDQYSGSGEPNVTVVRVQLPLRHPRADHLFQSLRALPPSIVR